MVKLQILHQRYAIFFVVFVPNSSIIFIEPTQHIAQDPCKIKSGSNGKLLDRVHVTTEDELKPVSGVKIFCATYTMEANHKGNVNTMRSTWTKRCDGYVAFSTAADPDIPAIKIEHEGVR